MKEPLLVATDGGGAAASALRFAAAYLERSRTRVEIISVVEPLAGGAASLPHQIELEEAHAQGVGARIRQQLREVAGEVDWPVHVRRGRPAPEIAALARDRQAALVVLGTTRQKADGNATAVELIQLCDQPVLTVHDGDLPRKAVVGIDFRPGGTRAALLTASLVGPEGTIHLVHVRPRLDFPAALVWDWGESYDLEVAQGFDRIRAALTATGPANLETRVEDGDPASALIKAARELKADLLAVGSDGYTFRGRVIIGRVAQRLVREAPVSVLAVPASQPTVAASPAQERAGQRA